VNRPERPADLRVAQADEPVPRRIRLRLGVAADRLDEDQFGELRQDAAAAEPARLAFAHGGVDQPAQPAVLGVGPVGDVQERRQRPQQRVEWPRVAAQEAADNPRRLRPVAAGVKVERPRVLGRRGGEGREVGLGAHVRRARERMRIAVRKD
jgi:hypothetical protein